MNDKTIMLLTETTFLIHNNLQQLANEKYNLTKKSFIVVMIIAENKYTPQSQTQIAELIGADRATMVSILDYLEKHKFIIREKNENNRRENLIKLTSEGKKKIDCIKDIVKEDIKKSLVDVNDDDIEIFTNVLEKILENNDARTTKIHCRK